MLGPMESNTLPHVVGSTSEADTGKIFINFQHIVIIFTSFIGLDNLQPKTPLKTDKSTSKGYSTRSILKRRPKSWDMSFSWLRNIDAQEQLKVFWDKAINDNTYYFTDHHPPAHYLCMPPRFILKVLIVHKIKINSDPNF